MTTTSQLKNRRKYPRFQSTKEMYVFHYNFGKILEIGMGGILFSYVQKQDNNIKNMPTGTLFDAENRYIDDIPFQVVYDSVVSDSPSSKLIIKKRCITFGDLTESQSKSLESFILENINMTQ